MARRGRCSSRGYVTAGRGPTRLLADIGGTNVRFAVQQGGGPPTRVRNLRVADFTSLERAIATYLDRVAIPSQPVLGAFAVAAPIEGDRVRLTNGPWRFSISALRRRFALTRLDIINDFTAIALGVPAVGRDGRRKVGGGRALANEAIGVVGPGTGLGVSGLVPCGGRYVPLASEGGKVTLAPFDRLEAMIVEYVWRRRQHVSAERLLSGPGLSLLYEAVAAVEGERVRPLAASTITSRAVAGTCARCRSTVNTFCAMLGTVAADLALTLGARGGLYIAGGIVPKLGPLFARSPFRGRFQSKGRFSDYLSAIPTYVITHRNPGLIGLAGLPAGG